MNDEEPTPCLPQAEDIAEVQARHIHLAHKADGTLNSAFPSGTALEDIPFFQLVYEQHKRNILLWHEEDKARDPRTTDTVIAKVKRRIDRYNQERNDLIESIDESLQTILQAHGVTPLDEAPWNSETPGSIIDRLSILSLKRFHMGVQAQREDASAAHRENAKRKEGVLRQQREDLLVALVQLLRTLSTGERQLKLYKQYKMYNDPDMNPVLYKHKQPPHKG